jgi:hypothetical protein
MEQSTNSIIEQKLIVLNSKNSDKLNGEYLSNVRFNFRDVLKRDPDIFYTSVALQSAEIPCSFYNINVNNQTLKYTVNSVSYTLTVPESNYNYSTFITAFVAQFNAGGHGHTISMSFSKLTGKLTTTKLTGAYSIIFLYTGSTIGEVLGLLATSNYTITTFLSHPYMMNLLGIKKLKIMSSSFSMDNYDSAGQMNGSLLQTIPVDMPSYSIITYQNTSNVMNRLRNKTINEIVIEIRDEDGYLIDFNNVYWNMSIVMNIYRRALPSPNDDLNLFDIAMKTAVPDNVIVPIKKEYKVIKNEVDEENLKQLKLLTM